jgi:hypothetical protein
VQAGNHAPMSCVAYCTMARLSKVSAAVPIGLPWRLPQVAREGDAAAQRLGVGTLLGVAAPLLQQAIVSGAPCCGLARQHGVWVGSAPDAVQAMSQWALCRV